MLPPDQENTLNDALVAIGAVEDASLLKTRQIIMKMFDCNDAHTRVVLDYLVTRGLIKLEAIPHGGELPQSSDRMPVSHLQWVRIKPASPSN